MGYEPRFSNQLRRRQLYVMVRFIACPCYETNRELRRESGRNRGQLPDRSQETRMEILTQKGAKCHGSARHICVQKA